MKQSHTQHRTPGLAAFALGEPILPIGYLPNGRPIFPIAGGAPDDPPKDDPPKKDPPKDDPPKDDFKPPATQADLDRIIGDRVARERAKYADYDDLKAKAEAHDKAAEEAQTEQEKAVSAARAEGERSAGERANQRIVAAEARALAAEHLVDGKAFRIGAASVVRLLDLTGVKVDDNGEVDAAAIKVKLDDLAKAEPDLVVDAKKPPKKDPSQGGGGGDDTATLERGRALYDERHKKKTPA